MFCIQNGSYNKHWIFSSVGFSRLEFLTGTHCFLCEVWTCLFLVKCYIWSIALCGAETGTVRAVDKKQLESFETWCWRRMEKISWTDHVRNEEMLLRVNEQRNILHAIRKRKANWIGHILRRNCLLKQVIEGKISGETEVTRRQGRRRKKLLDDLMDRRGYCHLKEEAVDRNMWRDRFGRGFEPVVRQTTGSRWHSFGSLTCITEVQNPILPRR